MTKDFPKTAMEALDLAWELAHPVKEGQVIPAGTYYLVNEKGDLPATMKSGFSFTFSSWAESNIRTLDPLPNPEPDWLDAPAVMAMAEGFSYRRIWVPVGDGDWASVEDGRAHWSELWDVTPLWPK